MTHPTDFNDRMLSLGLARVSEQPPWPRPN
jgi:hypothetical protein